MDSGDMILDFMWKILNSSFIISILSEINHTDYNQQSLVYMQLINYQINLPWIFFNW